MWKKFTVLGNGYTGKDFLRDLIEKNLDILWTEIIDSSTLVLAIVRNPLDIINSSNMTITEYEEFAKLSKQANFFINYNHMIEDTDIVIGEIIKYHRIALCEDPERYSIINFPHLYTYGKTGYREICHITKIPEYELVIGKVQALGSWCATKYQLNRYFSPADDPNITKQGKADLFDWLFIYSYDKLADAFLTSFTDIFEKSDLVESENKCFINRKYDMSWCHLYDSNLKLDHDVILTKNTDFNIAYPIIKSKIDYLRNRMIEAKNVNTLYVSTVYFIKDLSYASITKLRNSIANFRQNDNFVLLLISHVTIHAKPVPNVIYRYCDKDTLDYKGDNKEQWDKIMNDFTYSF